MKKLNKNFLSIGLIVLFFSAVMVFIAKAQLTIPDYFRSDSATSTAIVSDDSMGRDGRDYRIMSLSGLSYFVPNKTMNEFSSFLNNTPPYLSWSRCGDSVCQLAIENPDNCSADCSGDNRRLFKYCGDGVCTTDKSACDGFTDFGKMVSCDYLYDQGENFYNCPADCVEPALNSVCGVCGDYYDGITIRVCPNKCYDNARNLINCRKNESENYVDYSSYEGSSELGFSRSGFSTSEPEQSTPNPGIWSCVQSGELGACPQGYYCPVSGRAVDGTVTCPAGYFCPSATIRPRLCPPGFYSLAGASSCTKCDNFKYSFPGSTGPSSCYYINLCGDGNCDIESPYFENPNNCPQDCNIPGDNKCTGSETLALSPSECFCGNNTCDTGKGESGASCRLDCPNGRCEFNETAYIHLAVSGVKLRPSDCYCGNGTCDLGEGWSNCQSDCSCGDNFCNEFIGENIITCKTDCKCGNSSCDSGESSLNCAIDCPRCGNGVCNTNPLQFLSPDLGVGFVNVPGENSGLLSPSNPGGCPADCKPNDGICDEYELNNAGAGVDCSCGKNGCESALGENSTNCIYDCGTCGDNKCSYSSNGKIEVKELGSLSPLLYVACPGDCGAGDRITLPILETGQ